MPALTVAVDPEGAADAVADVLGRIVEEARSAHGEAHLGLAGGETPRRAYELLGARLASWEGVHLWFCDERVTSPDQRSSNHAMVSETLLVRADVAPARVHRVAVEAGAREAAARYEAELRATVPVGEAARPALDVALLGLGADGHTASLFPGDPALSSGVGLCVAVERAPKPPPVRVTLTLDALGAARRIVFLAVGADKRLAVEALLSGPDPDVPASLVAGEGSELIVDADAAPEGELESKRSGPGAPASGLPHVPQVRPRSRAAG